jgi:hypothetical protein
MLVRMTTEMRTFQLTELRDSTHEAAENGFLHRYGTAMDIWADRLDDTLTKYDQTHPYHQVLALLSEKKRRIQAAKLPLFFRGEPFEKLFKSDPDMTLAVYKAAVDTGCLYPETRLEVGTVFLPGEKLRLKERVSYAADLLVRFSHDDVIFGMERLQHQLNAGIPNSLAEGIDPNRVEDWEHSVPISA